MNRRAFLEFVTLAMAGTVARVTAQEPHQALMREYWAQQPYQARVREVERLQAELKRINAEFAKCVRANIYNHPVVYHGWD